MRPLAVREVKMKKNIYRVLGLVAIFGALFSLGLTKPASAGINVNIDIAIPPPYQFAGPPDVYVVPSGSSYVYMAPDYEGIYFYGGNWYRYYNERWFRSSHYNGDWGYIETSNVPQVIIVVPPEYIHYVPSGYYRIHYDDFHSNWQTWDQGRHWDSYDWYQHESSDAIRHERYNSIESNRQQHGVQSSQHQQGHQQQNVQKQQKQNSQKQQKHNVKKPQKQNSKQQQKNGGQKQQHDAQKPQQQQGEKEHGGNK